MFSCSTAVRARSPAATGTNQISATKLDYLSYCVQNQRSSREMYNTKSLKIASGALVQSTTRSTSIHLIWISELCQIYLYNHVGYVIEAGITQ